MKEPILSIEEVSTPQGVEYNIVSKDDTGAFTIAKCWEPFLAERIRDTVYEVISGGFEEPSAFYAGGENE